MGQTKIDFTERKLYETIPTMVKEITTGILGNDLEHNMNKAYFKFCDRGYCFSDEFLTLIYGEQYDYKTNSIDNTFSRIYYEGELVFDYNGRKKQFFIQQDLEGAWLTELKATYQYHLEQTELKEKMEKKKQDFVEEHEKIKCLKNNKKRHSKE